MSLSDTLFPYIRAAFAGLWIITSEPDDAARELNVLAHLHGWGFAVWDIANGSNNQDDPMAGDKNPISALNAKFNEDRDTKLIALHNYHRFLNDPVVMQHLINHIIAGKGERRFYVVLAPHANMPVELQRLFTVLEHHLPNEDELLAIANDLYEVPDNPHTGNLECARAALGLTRGEAENAFALSLVKTGDMNPKEVYNLKAQAIKKTGLLTLSQSHETFTDIGGLDGLKTFCHKSLRSRHPSAASRGVVLLGLSGTGKSAFARALGNECGRPTLELDVGRLMGSLVGETEQNLRRAIGIAESVAPCILFIDEVEKALSGVGGSGDSGVATRLFGHLLTWLNDHTSDVYVVCTCNDISKLPPEFSRAERWDGVFFLDLPTPEQKKQIWNIYAKKFFPGYEVTGWDNADDQWTGAEIKACCRLAALLDLPLNQAADHVVPVAMTAKEQVQALRQWASGRALCAETGTVYNHKTTTTKPKQRRTVNV